jgi:hypothetical protein
MSPDPSSTHPLHPSASTPILLSDFPATEPAGGTPPVSCTGRVQPTRQPPPSPSNANSGSPRHPELEEDSCAWSAGSRAVDIEQEEEAAEAGGRAHPEGDERADPTEDDERADPTEDDERADPTEDDERADPTEDDERADSAEGSARRVVLSKVFIFGTSRCAWIACVCHV